MIRTVVRGEEVRRYERRFQVMLIVAVGVFLILVGRLFQLQVLEGEQFARKAEANFTARIDVPAPRGRIFDAKGNALAANRPAYTLHVTARPGVAVPEPGREGGVKVEHLPIEDADIADLVDRIQFADDTDRKKFEARLVELREDPRDGRYAVAVRNNLSWPEVAQIQTRESLRRWVEIRESARRYYPEAAVTAFITGYMREIDPGRLRAAPHGEYRPGDRVGQTGLERHWENYLRGRLGSDSRVVNNVGREVKDPPRAAVAALPPDRAPIPGQDLHLSVDIDLQRVAWEAFAGKPAGALVAMEVRTGRILAMVSVPAIDPNRWEYPISRSDYQAWLEDPLKPFVDKSVQENFFPGSTYKIVSALAVLEDPSFDPDATIECLGYTDYGNRRFKDTHRHGIVDLEQALVQSCNVYFYHLVTDAGLTLAKMERVARRLGLGERTGLGINAEVRGVVPTEASESRQGTFQRGVLLNSAIGQGNVKATVLQIAVLYAAVGNGGWVVTPSLVDRIVTWEGKTVLQTSTQHKNERPIVAPFDRERIHRGLVGVVNDERGTAFSERIEGIPVAGKTGTAEVGKTRARPGEPEIEGWDITQDHAWFAAYAPVEQPEVVVVAMVEHGGAGADAAAPIVMQVIEHFMGESEGAERPALRAPGVPPQLPGGSRKGGTP